MIFEKEGISAVVRVEEYLKEGVSLTEVRITQCLIMQFVYSLKQRGIVSGKISNDLSPNKDIEIRFVFDNICFLLSYVDKRGVIIVSRILEATPYFSRFCLLENQAETIDAELDFILKLREQIGGEIG